MQVHTVSFNMDKYHTSKSKMVLGMLRNDQNIISYRYLRRQITKSAAITEAEPPSRTPSAQPLDSEHGIFHFVYAISYIIYSLYQPCRQQHLIMNISTQNTIFLNVWCLNIYPLIWILWFRTFPWYMNQLSSKETFYIQPQCNYIIAGNKRNPNNSVINVQPIISRHLYLDQY